MEKEECEDSMMMHYVCQECVCLFLSDHRTASKTVNTQRITYPTKEYDLEMRDRRSKETGMWSVTKICFVSAREETVTEYPWFQHVRIEAVGPILREIMTKEKDREEPHLHEIRIDARVSSRQWRRRNARTP